MEDGYAICFNEWALDKDIKNDLGLLLIISSLCAEKGYCYASNDYLSNLFEVDNVTISRKIKNLEDKGYITISYKMSGNVVKSREIRLTKMLKTINKNVNGAVNKNVKDKNTSINITNNNIITKKDIYTYYEDKIGMISPNQYEMFNDLLDKVGEDKVREAIDIAVGTGQKVNLNYIIKISTNPKWNPVNNKSAKVPQWMNEFEDYEKDEMSDSELEDFKKELGWDDLFGER